MICDWCKKCAEYGVDGWTHTHVDKREPEKTCPQGTWCDCQHREPGTAVNYEQLQEARQAGD